MTGAHPFASVSGADLRPAPVDRAGQVGRVCGIVAMLLRSSHPLVPLLRQAERDDRALARALDMIDALPSRTRRQLICTFGATQWACQRARPRRQYVAEPVGKFSDLPQPAKDEAAA